MNGIDGLPVLSAEVISCSPLASCDTILDESSRNDVDFTGITFTLEIVVQLEITNDPIAPAPIYTPETFITQFEKIEEEFLEDIFEQTGEPVVAFVIGDVETDVIVSTQSPTQSPTFTGQTAVRIVSGFMFDSTSRDFCMQVMNFSQDRKFKMRPCSNKQSIRSKQEWYFEPNGQLRNVAKPEWCASWKPKDKSLGLSKCDSNSPRTKRFSFNEYEHSLVVENELNGKIFRIGFNTRKKYDSMRLYRSNNNMNNSLYTFSIQMN